MCYLFCNDPAISSQGCNHLTVYTVHNISLIHFLQGMIDAVRGPTLQDLSVHFNTSISAISTMFIFSVIGVTIGNISSKDAAAWLEYCIIMKVNYLVFSWVSTGQVSKTKICGHFHICLDPGNFCNTYSPNDWYKGLLYALVFLWSWHGWDVDRGQSLLPQDLGRL